MSKSRIMVVDDDEQVRNTRALLLRASGYDVSLARHGFDALLQLKSHDVPNLIVSDLNMPEMSGFEFLSVLRRRFPEIPVVASSGAYISGDTIPGGVIADGFFPKGASPSMFLKMVADLLESPMEVIRERHSHSAPVWIPRNGHDSNGVPFIVVTCTDCLRSFPLSVLHENLQEVQETDCLFCGTTVRYIIDFSRDVTSPKRAKTASIPAPKI